MKGNKFVNKGFIQHHFEQKKVVRGFTLIELLIVVAVVALLAILAINMLTRQIWKGNDARRKADLKRIGVAAEEYEKDNNCYPQRDEMLTCGSDANIAIHPYLSVVPCDPVTKAPYYYEPGPGSCPSWYRIYAALQNTSDPAILAHIGLGGAYNFYERSPNAPILEPSPSGAPGPSASTGSNLYACQGGYLVLITWDPSLCAQTFPSSAFQSSCGTPQNPQNDCYPPGQTPMATPALTPSPTPPLVPPSAQPTPTRQPPPANPFQ